MASVTLRVLPAGEISQDEFTTWKNELLATLAEDMDHQLFIPGGIYKEWTPAKESNTGKQITELHPNDPARMRLEKRFKHRKLSNDDQHFLLDELLTGRNSQLKAFIEYIYSFAIHHCHSSSIKQECTSFESIMSHLVNPDEISYKPGNIFDLADIQISSNEDYNAFYTRFRGAVNNNIKSSPLNTEYLKNSDIIDTLPPSFEEFIILWCLEKIDHRLPNLAKQTFSEKMNSDNISLLDIQNEIFDNIQEILDECEEYDRKESDNSNYLDNVEFENNIDDENYEREQTFIVLKQEENKLNPSVINEIERNQETSFNELFDEYSDVDMEAERIEESPQEELHPENPLQCRVCNKVFSNKKKLSDHSSSHKLEECVCEFCENSYKTRRALSEHISRHHRLTFACTSCDAILQGQAKYEKHLKDFHREQYVDYYDQRLNKKGFVCRYCSEALPSVTALREHNRQHKEENKLDFIETGEKRAKSQPAKIKTAEPTENICDICGKTVGFKYMEQHKKIHSTENLICHQCDVSFNERKTYLTHMRSHRISAEKTASCEHCGMTFGRTSHLKTHMKIHIVGEKLKCDVCRRTFFDKKEMGSHVCKHHACDICGAKFLRARNLEFHKRMHFGTMVFSCNQCESLFLTKKRLNEHVNHQHKKEKKYVCDVCDKRFLMKSGLTQHTLTHTGEKPFKCDQCELRFTQKGNLETHQKLHTDEMAYVCSVCDAKFRQAGELKRHREFKKCGFSQNDFYSTSDDGVIKMLQEDDI